MRMFRLIYIAIIVCTVAVSCVSTPKITARDVKTYPQSGAEVKINEAIEFSYSSEKSFDSVVLVLDGKRYSFDHSSKSLNSPTINTYRDIEYNVVFYNKAGNYVYNGSLKCYPQPPSYHNVELISSFEHLDKSHTQGYCIDEGKLYESSGEYGKSYIRVIDLKSRKEIARKNIGDRYFAEGIAVIGDELYLLTWMEKTLFVYDKNTLELKKTLPLDLEGWGLTTDGTYLYLSDGSEYIYTISPKDLTILQKNMVVTNNGAVNYINELEWIDGYIYANVFTTDYIVKINPQTWAIESINYAKDLWVPLPENNTEDVLNGIAYDKQSGKVYITGKKWDKVYEVKLQ